MTAVDTDDAVDVLFIAGWGRSGSTLLDRLLGAHPDVVGVGELRDVWLRGPLEDRPCGCGATFLTCPFWNQVGVTAFADWEQVDAASLSALRLQLDRPWHLIPLVSPKGFPRYRRRLHAYTPQVESLYRAIRDTAGARVVVDSSNIATTALLLRRVPGLRVRVVHLVRDSRGVVNSWGRKTARPGLTPSGADEMPRYGVAAACLRYTVYNHLAELLAPLRLPYLRVRYEDLVREPADQLDRIWRFAGVRPLPAGGTGATYDLPVHHSVDGNPGRMTSGGITLRLDESWTRELAVHRRRVVNALTAFLLWRYRYLERG